MKFYIIVLVYLTIYPINGKKSFAGITYDLGAKFLKALNKPYSNALISPSTLAASYALVYAASQGQSKSEINNIVFANWTESEIYDSTRRYTASSASKKFRSVEKIFYQQDTTPGGPLPSRELNQLIGDVFNTTVDKADFANNIESSRSTINQWVSDKTHNKVRQLFGASDLKSDAVMVLASAAALDGGFTYGFSPNDTNQRFFYSNANTASVNYFMSQTCVRLFYGETSQAIAVGLPCGAKEQAVAFFIMPKQKYALQALEDKIADEDHLTEILDNSIDYSKVVMVTIPKFKLDVAPYNIRPTLMIMGTTTMFAQGFVDFSKINSRKNLYVTHAAHKAFFEAKEGATRLCPNDGTSDLDKVSVTFNQPFVVAVVEKSTRNLLLYGHVMSVD